MTAFFSRQHHYARAAPTVEDAIVWMCAESARTDSILARMLHCTAEEVAPLTKRLCREGYLRDKRSLGELWLTCTERGHERAEAVRQIAIDTETAAAT